ncbi:MAG TPA: NAD(P)-dependent oxidoreductase [Sphingobacteriaceae bacterium]|nr:NAD(P)-dependent oxidoreductase [Sphingobacteriaceae bacterium]
MPLNKSQAPRVLIVDDIHPIFLDIIQNAGFMVDYRPLITYQETCNCISDYQVLVLRSKFKVDPPLIDLANNLKVIARAGAGVDNIDIDYAEQKDIQLISANEGNCDAVGEHMLGMLLSLSNNLHVADSEIREGKWLREENRGFELGGKSVALIGYGNNGQAMARKLSGFEVEILAYDKYRVNYSDAFANEATMADVFEKADIISLHIPLTTETRGLINERFISQFEKPFYFLNGSRGEVVNMVDILRGLENRKILGAAFDVLPVENFPALAFTDWFEELKKYPNVLLSPHIAGWTTESYFKIAKVLAEKLVSL